MEHLASLVWIKVTLNTIAEVFPKSNHKQIKLIYALDRSNVLIAFKELFNKYLG